MAKTNSEIKKLIKDFLSPSKKWPAYEDEKQVEKTMEDLDELLKECNARYYDNGQSPITDSEYDLLLKRLKLYEQGFPHFTKKDSITKKIEVQSEHSSLSMMPKVKHETKMQSLGKVHSFEDLEKWLKRTQRKIGHTFHLKIENKYDGIAAKLIYRNGKLRNCVLRGDGNEGFDVFEAVAAVYNRGGIIRGIPRYLEPSSDTKKVIETFRGQEDKEEVLYPQDLEIVGELVVLSKDLAELNKMLIENKRPPYPTQRHAAAALVSLRSFTSLSFVTYEVNKCENPDFEGTKETKPCFRSTEDTFDWLRTIKGLWVTNAEFATIKQNAVKYEGAFEAINRIERRRPDLEFAIDGAVLKVVEDSYRKLLGRGRKSPNWAIAYKFSPATASAQLERIDWNIGRSGVFSPVAIFKPVCISGVWYSHALLHNPGKIAALGLCKNDIVFIQRRGDVIPAVVGVDEATRSSHPVHIGHPGTCPYCGAELIYNETALRCPTRRCPGREEEIILYCTSKNVFNLRKLRKLGTETVRELYRKKVLLRPEDFFSLTVDVLKANLEKPKSLGDKEWDDKLKEIVDEVKIATRNLTWPQAIMSLSIPGISSAQAKALDESYDLHMLPEFEPNLDLKGKYKSLEGTAVYKSLEEALTWPEIRSSIAMFKGIISPW